MRQESTTLGHVLMTNGFAPWCAGLSGLVAVQLVLNQIKKHMGEEVPTPRSMASPSARVMPGQRSNTSRYTWAFRPLWQWPWKHKAGEAHTRAQPALLCCSSHEFGAHRIAGWHARLIDEHFFILVFFAVFEISLNIQIQQRGLKERVRRNEPGKGR